MVDEASSVIASGAGSPDSTPCAKRPPRSMSSGRRCAALGGERILRSEHGNGRDGSGAGEELPSRIHLGTQHSAAPDVSP